VSSTGSAYVSSCRSASRNRPWVSVPSLP